MHHNPWPVYRCGECGNVQTYTLRELIVGRDACRSCGAAPPQLTAFPPGHA